MDLIERQAAIDAIEGLPNCYNGFSDSYDKSYIIGALEELPSAEPVIYCKYCIRHNVSVQDWYDNHELKVCPLVEHRGKAQGHEFDYQFCAYAERKEDE